MTDLRLSKRVDVKPVSVSLYLDINNLLNTKRLSYTGFSDIYDRYDYLNSLHFHDEKGVEKGSDKIGKVRDEGVPYTRSSASGTSVTTRRRVTTGRCTMTTPANPILSGKQMNTFPQIRNFVDGVYDHKAYINMPDIESFTFLNPRKVTFGITLNF
ncbi:MAG: hypothetical protein U5N26_11190 [Candidatus Marinimicrobia bacterium]|nr:hypothetical protein [Candidatus Neomarinimicrobiota bacterium]